MPFSPPFSQAGNQKPNNNDDNTYCQQVRCACLPQEIWEVFNRFHKSINHASFRRRCDENFSEIISEKLGSLNGYNILCSWSQSVVSSFLEEISESPVHKLSFYAYWCNLNALEDLFTISVGKMLKTCLEVTSRGLNCRIDSEVPNSWAHTLSTISWCY